MNNNNPVTIKDVAKRAKVALATVDRVLHNRKGVSKKTREKVLKVIKDLNYQPNLMASNLSKKKTLLLGILLPNVSPRSSYWELPLKGIRIDRKVKGVLDYLAETASSITTKKILVTMLSAGTRT